MSAYPSPKRHLCHPSPFLYPSLHAYAFSTLQSNCCNAFICLAFNAEPVTVQVAEKGAHAPALAYICPCPPWSSVQEGKIIPNYHITPTPLLQRFVPKMKRWRPRDNLVQASKVHHAPM